QQAVSLAERYPAHAARLVSFRFGLASDYSAILCKNFAIWLNVLCIGRLLSQTSLPSSFVGTLMPASGARLSCAMQAGQVISHFPENLHPCVMCMASMMSITSLAIFFAWWPSTRSKTAYSPEV